MTGGKGVPRSYELLFLELRELIEFAAIGLLSGSPGPWIAPRGPWPAGGSAGRARAARQSSLQRAPV